MLIESLARGALALSGLLLPGAGWALAMRWPLPWFGGALASVAAIFVGVVGFSIAGVPVNLTSLTCWLVAVGAPGWWRFFRGRGHARAEGSDRGEWWIALPMVLLVAVAVWRAVAQPMWSADATFRWNLLAELIVLEGNLDFYPPTSPGDFARYFWADGIAPLVSGVYAWVYLAAGSTEPVWTAIPVLMQTGLLLALLREMAREHGGATAGWFAWTFAAASMLLQFAFNLGQETGFTALGACGMILYLMRWDAARESRLLWPAAVCAAVAACAREYGAVALICGAAWIAVAGRAPRAAILFALASAILPSVWHARVWLTTGNPVYANGVAGVFPTNPVFDAWMRGYAEVHGGVLGTSDGWIAFARYVGVSAFAPLAGLVVGLGSFRGDRRAALAACVAVAFAAAWLVSIPYTAGGLFYSMRVLSPVLVIGCAWGGVVAARWAADTSRRATVFAVLAVLSVDAALRSLTVPRNPYDIRPADWLTAGDTVGREFEESDAAFLDSVARTGTGAVLSDSAGLGGVFGRHARTIRPIWSPDVAWLFDEADESDAVARLRELGYSHLLFKRTPFSEKFLRESGALRRLGGRTARVMSNDNYVLFEVLSDGAPGP